MGWLEAGWRLRMEEVREQSEYKNLGYTRWAFNGVRDLNLF